MTALDQIKREASAIVERSRQQLKRPAAPGLWAAPQACRGIQAVTRFRFAAFAQRRISLTSARSSIGFGT